MTFASQLRAARNARSHTQEQTAREIGVSWSSIAKWEAGRHEPTGLQRKSAQKYIRGAISAPETDLP